MDPRTLNLDPASVAAKITGRTKAIIAGASVRAVLRYGSRFMELARPRGHPGGRRLRPRRRAPSIKGRKAGALGDIGVFSFHQQKNMVTLGEGGMLTTSSKRPVTSVCCRSGRYAAAPTIPRGNTLPLDEAVQPMGKRYWYLDFDEIGFNYRMTDAQAAVGLVQLQKLDEFNARRIEIAGAYSSRAARHQGHHDPSRLAGRETRLSHLSVCWWNPSSG